MGVHFACYGCPPASMGVLTPIVKYNSPPMDQTYVCTTQADLPTLAKRPGNVDKDC